MLDRRPDPESGRGARAGARPAGRGRSRGFSLIELIVTLAIAGILLGLALPSLGALIGGSAMSATVNDLVFALQSARSEAIKRAAPVALCPSANALDADARCGGSYAGGWIVFVERDTADGLRGATEDLLLQVEPRTTAFTITTPDGALAERVLFDETGASTSPTGIPLSGTIRVVHARGSETRNIDVRANGRVASSAPPEAP